jgi:peroxiredoxin
LVLIALSALACAPESVGGEAAQSPETPIAEEDTSEPFRVVSPTERVPAFRVVATNGSVFDSSQLVGKQPFVVAFYATWCKVCEFKLPELLDVLAEAGSEVSAFGVSVDDAETWKNVERYVARHRLPFPTVRGQSFPRFALSYDPFQTVPVVAVVGRNGYLVDYQIGYSHTHRQRLAAAVELARRMTPDSPPLYRPKPDPDAPPSDPEVGL